MDKASPLGFDNSLMHRLICNEECVLRFKYLEFNDFLKEKLLFVLNFCKFSIFSHWSGNLL